MRRALSATFLLLLSSAAACSGDDDSGSPDASSPVAADANAPSPGDGDPDAAPAAAPDAAAMSEADAGPGAGSSALGRPCTGSGQGDCPEGFECIPGETGPWCTLRCEDQDDDRCAAGYDGPGHPACILTVTINEETFRACTVVCDAEDGFDDDLCAPDTCDGTCPGELACTGRIDDADSGDRIGSACE